jgi:hypothetical protein
MNSPYSIEKLNTISESNFSRNDNLIEIRNQVINLEENNKILQGENERLINLNHILQKERIELNSLNDTKENTIREQIIILDNLKLKNEKYENRIIDLEKINSDLNYQIIELNQKNKTLIENQNILLESVNQKDLAEKLINLSQQLENIAIIKSRLEHDNKILINKINSLQLEHENEINMIKTIHNSDITKKNKVITNLQNGLSQLKLNTNDINNNILNTSSIIHPQSLMEEFSIFERKTKIIKDDNIKLYSINNDLQNKIKIYENNKEKDEYLIKNLQNKLKNVEEELKIKKEESEIRNKEIQYNFEKFNQEREELIKQNNNFKNAYNNLNNNIKDTNELFNQKVKSFKDLISNYNLKIRELQMKSDELNQQNELLNLENEKLKRANQRYEKREINLTKKIPVIKKRNLSVNGSGKNLLNNSFNNSNKKNNNNDNMNNTFNINEYNNNSYNISNVKGINEGNLLTYNNLEDPFVLSQQKSLEDFKNVLQRVDENLSENNLLLNNVKDTI